MEKLNKYAMIVGKSEYVNDLYNMTGVSTVTKKENLLHKKHSALDFTKWHYEPTCDLSNQQGSMTACQASKTAFRSRCARPGGTLNTRVMCELTANDLSCPNF